MKSLAIIASFAAALSRAELCQVDYLLDDTDTTIWRTTERPKQVADNRFTVLPLFSKAQVLRHKEI
jgi:hypothetical protein